MSAKVIFQFCGMTKITVNADNYPSILQNVIEPDKQNGIYHRSVETSSESGGYRCIPKNISSPDVQNLPANPEGDGSQPVKMFDPASQAMNDNTPSISATKLFALVQHIYAAQARVQLEVNEIKRAQAVANAAQKTLEEAANNVRVITSALQSAQQDVANAAVRAQTAQLQLAAHDQLLFAARQKVDALSSQMVGLQTEDGVGNPKNAINLQALLAQLKEPLTQNQTPTPITPIDKPFVGDNGNANGNGGKIVKAREGVDYEFYYDLSN